MQKQLGQILGMAIIGLAILWIPQQAEAQYYGYGRYGGYQGTPYQSRYSFRHRMHGYLGGQVMGMAMLHQRVDGVGHVGSGGGFGLFGGARLSPFIALELNWTFTFHDESWNEGNWVIHAIDMLSMQTITGDLKIHIPTFGPLEPFVQVGGGFGFLGVTGDYYNDGYIFTSGPMFNLGGGLDLWFGPFFSIGGRVLYRGIYFTESDHAGNLDADSNFVNALSFEANAQFHF